MYIPPAMSRMKTTSEASSTALLTRATCVCNRMHASTTGFHMLLACSKRERVSVALPYSGSAVEAIP